MRKLLVVLTVVGAVAVGVAGVAYADSPAGLGVGCLGGSRMGARMGPMHELMESAVADELGLSVDEVESRLANGETMWQIITAQGLSDEQARDLLQRAHDRAVEQAIEQGLITREQADSMQQHMQGGSMMGGQGLRSGGCHRGHGGAGESGTAGAGGRSFGTRGMMGKQA